MALAYTPSLLFPRWVIIFNQVVESEKRMLTNYDAKSVAEVMGIAFLRSPKADFPLAATSPTREEKASKSSASASNTNFTIRVDGTDVLVVRVERNGSSNQIMQSSGRANRSSDSGDNLVSPPSPALIEKAVERGLPRHALRHVAEWLAGGDKAKASSLEWGVVPKTTLDRRETQLSPQESERTERVARLFVHARRALGTEAEAREFMTTPHPRLDERSPVDAARTDLGARRTEQILNAIEYGLAL